MVRARDLRSRQYQSLVAEGVRGGLADLSMRMSEYDTMLLFVRYSLLSQETDK